MKNGDRQEGRRKTEVDKKEGEKWRWTRERDITWDMG
jgi:hypothetical protein